MQFRSQSFLFVRRRYPAAEFCLASRTADDRRHGEPARSRGEVDRKGYPIVPSFIITHILPLAHVIMFPIIALDPPSHMK
jgi:hypothetical protein